MPNVVGFLNSLDEQNFSNLLQEFQDQLQHEVSPRPCNRSGPNVPNNLGANEVFVCTRWAQGDYTQLNTLAQQLSNLTPTPNVIAAMGGIVSALSAERSIPDIPIIFLTGRHASEESDSHHKNTRGIYLETTRFSVENTLRHRKLRTLFNFNNNNIYNLMFKASVAHNDEKDWTNPIVVADTTQKALNDAFNQIIGLGNKIQGLTISADSYLFTRKTDIVQFANTQLQKPVIYPFRGWVDAGGLMSYGPNLTEMYRAMGSWAGQIVVNNLSGTQLAQLSAKQLVNEFIVKHTTAVALLGAQEAARIEQGAIVV